MQFRRDINGLRAVAVAAVVLYHLNVRPFSGGFVGVDVFFVISGYLIASVIRQDLERGAFSLLSFVAKRLRRILPALSLVCFAIVAWAGAFYLPDDYKHLVRIATAVLTFRGNVWFSENVGYFEPDKEASYFLHTWSLATEAHFYGLFAVLCISLGSAVVGNRRPVGTLLFCALLAISLAWCVYQTDQNQRAAFYLLPSRMWEFLVGALVASHARPLKNKIVILFVRGLGTLLLSWSIFSLTDGDPFPGWRALLPAIGTAMLLLPGVPSSARKWSILGSAPFQFLGMISYSVYLWHWPLLAAYREKAGAEPGGVAATILMLTTVAVGWLTYRFVECPSRQRWSTRCTFVVATGTVGVAFTYLTLVSLTDGLPGRLPAYLRPAIEAMRNPNRDADQCSRAVDGTKRSPGDFCEIGAVDRPASVILWGDSFADRLQPIVAATLSSRQKRGIVATQGGCPPFRGKVFKGSGAEVFPGCEAYANFVFNYFKAHPEISIAVVAADWQRYQPEYEGEVLQEIADILAARDGHLILVGMVPNPHADVAREWASMQFRKGGTVDEWAVPLASQHRLVDHWARMSAQVATAANTIIVDPGRALCDTAVCYRVKEGSAWYSDTDHLSQTGVAQMEPLLVEAIENVTS